MKADTICIRETLQYHYMLRWAVFSREYHTSRKYAHHLFQEPLKFIAHGNTFGK